MNQVDAVFDLNDINNIPPFSLAKQEKDAFYADALYGLTKHHYANCVQYQKILDVLGFDPTIKQNIEDIPPIPVRLFKDYDLLSVDKSQIIKTMTSSGTTGRSVSKIFLDRITSTNQTKVLTKLYQVLLVRNGFPCLLSIQKR